MSDIVARCVPKPYYWLIGVVLYPAVGVVLSAVVVRPLLLLAGIDLIKGPLIETMVVVTLVTASWAYWRDYRRLCYVLLPDALQLGRGNAAIIVPFSDIESVVPGLPERLHWIFRLQRFNPKGQGIYRNVVDARATTLLLRLTNARYLPLNTRYSFLKDGHRFMAEFLRLNHGKVVGRETYSDREIAGLALGASNTIKMIPGR